jgi:hypothetical protein
MSQPPQQTPATATSSAATAPADSDMDNETTLTVREKVWQGRLPTKISLAANESKSFTNTPPVFVRFPSQTSHLDLVY